MVFYRKYRPQTIEDLDSAEVREELYSILSKDSFSHAFLFTGPKGLGKTSTARIVAKVINCEKIAVSRQDLISKTSGPLLNADIEPCNKCDQCLSITNGTNMDVLEIDAASNRGIDEIRDLRDKVKLAPFKALKKVYIIDEVHMLTTEAFNALLKTLEEPPAHVVFILCTTEAHKLPATILSRCFRVMFKTATEDELVRSFERIVKAEKLKADKEALKTIAHLSDGSFRDGVKILEEVSVITNGEITKDLVEKKYNLSSVQKQIADLLLYLKEKDSKKAFKLISEVMEGGVDVKYFLEQLINKLHLALLEKVGVVEKNNASIEFEITEIKRLVELFSKAYLDTKYAVLEQLPLEIAIVEWISGGTDILIQKQELPVKKLQTFAEAQQESQRINDKTNAATNIKSVQPSVFEQPKSAPVAPVRMTKMEQLFEDLVIKVKPVNHSVAGFLRGCSIKSYENGNLTIETNYKFHKEKLEEGKTKQIIENAANEITGEKITFYVLLRG